MMVLRKPVVLVVDAEEARLAALNPMLRDLPCELIHVRDGNDALGQCVGGRDVALMLLDADLCGMNSIEVIELLKSEPGTRHIPIIVLANPADGPTLCHKLLEAGAFDYMERPLDPVVFRRKVQSFIQMHDRYRQMHLQLARCESMHAFAKDSEARLRQTLRDAPIPIMIHAEDGEIVMLSSTWLHLAGYPAGELRTLGDWIGRAHGSQARSVARHFEGLTHQHGSVRQGEFAVTTAGGGSLTWEMTSSPLSPLPDGRGLAITLALDVTERKRYENALAHAKLEAERANRAKSRFLAAASHDLRQPLQGMQLYFGILSRRVPEDDSAMKGAMQCSEILKTQLDDLMDVAKLDSGATVPELGDCAIGGIIDKVAGGLKAGAEAKGLRLEVGDVDYTVRTDPVLFERLLLNVVSNAIKYTEKGCVLITCKRRAAKLVLQVWDSGIGIPAESRPHIFEEFFQVANSSRDRSMGSGLGLAIVSRIARMLFLRIRVLSRLGRGSVFLVEFPAG